MGTALTLAIVFLNVFSIIISVKMLKGFDKSKITIYVVIGELIMFVISNIFYEFTAGDIPPEVHQAAKWMILLTMLPINVMIINCPIFSLINKKAFNEIKESNLKKRIIIIFIITIVAFIFEITYIKNIQIGIANFAN